jgi:hypothetical protein
MRDDTVREVIASGLRRLEGDLERLTPHMAPSARAWLRRLARDDDPAAYFGHPRAFPFVAMPVWFERAATGTVDLSRQERLAASSMAGYLFIRILDGLIDGHAQEELTFLPLLGVLHERFQSPYLALFPAGHPFQERFAATWSGCLDATARDAQEGTATLSAFVEVTARKVDAARLPLQATALLLDREDALRDWMRFFDLLGCWHLMEEDLLDFNEDAARGARTYVLSAAAARRRVGQSAIGWLLDCGIDEISATLGAWMAELRDAAASLGTSEPATYLAQRDEQLGRAIDGMRSAMRTLARVDEAISRNAPRGQPA